MKMLYRGIFIATFKRTYIQDQARPIIVTSLLSYETSPYFSWRKKSLFPKILSQLEPWGLNKYSTDCMKYNIVRPCWNKMVKKKIKEQGFPSVFYYRSPWDSHVWFMRVLGPISRVPYCICVKLSMALFFMLLFVCNWHWLQLIIIGIDGDLPLARHFNKISFNV